MLSTKAWNYSRSFEGHNRRKNTITLQNNLFATLLDKYFLPRRKSVSLAYLSLLFETRNASLKAVFFFLEMKRKFKYSRDFERPSTKVINSLTSEEDSHFADDNNLTNDRKRTWDIFKLPQTLKYKLSFATFNPKFGNFDHKFYS